VCEHSVSCALKVCALHIIMLEEKAHKCLFSLCVVLKSNRYVNVVHQWGGELG
jgi:hypothetical protein